MDTDYYIQPFSLDSYPLMKELFLSAFELKIDAAAFHKQFDTKILGHEVIGFLAIYKITKEPAAYYGVFPVKVLIHGKEVLCAQSGATMTHKNHRKKGLFLELAKATFEMCKRQGVQLIFGMPNQNSYHGFTKRLDWIHLDDINTYDLKLRFKTLPLARFLNKTFFFGFYLKCVKLLLKGKLVNEPKNFINPTEGCNKILRNNLYLTFKNTTDKIFITIGEIVLWVRLTDVLWIGDFNDYNLVNEKVIKKLKRLALLLGYNTIRFNFNESLPQPSFLSYFNKTTQEASCFFYLNEVIAGTNLVLTAADFDTW